MGAHKQTVSGWENGRSWPEYEKLLSISKELKIHPEQLFETIGKEPIKPSTEEALDVVRRALAEKSPAHSLVTNEIAALPGFTELVQAITANPRILSILMTMITPATSDQSKRKPRS